MKAFANRTKKTVISTAKKYNVSAINQVRSHGLERNYCLNYIIKKFHLLLYLHSALFIAKSLVGPSKFVKQINEIKYNKVRNPNR